MICPNCNANVDSDKKFCPNCGATLPVQTPPPPAYSQPMMNQQDCEPLSTGQFVLMDFLAAIPLVGLILYFVWAFSSGENPNRRNWAKAKLIWLLISIVASILIVILFGATLAGALNAVSNWIY